MKNIFTLLVILLLAVGCNKEKGLQKNLTGTFQAYKYMYRSADETKQFFNQYGSYTITFNGSGKFIRSYSKPDTTLTAGTYHFANNDQELVLVDSVYTPRDSVYILSINQEQYTIFDLSG